MTRNFLSENLNADDLNFAKITCMDQKCSSGSEGNRGVKLIKQANLFIDKTRSLAVRVGSTMWTSLNKVTMLYCCEPDI